MAHSNGFTFDAYSNTPVGTDTLNFGPRAFKNVSAWNTPDGINGILAWTAVPATDVNDSNTASTPSQLLDSSAYPSYARISVSNAVAAIEGYIAVNYLEKHHDFQLMDTNHDGVITAQEVTNFVLNAKAMGIPEAGAMANLLGGTATYGPVEAGINNEVFNENPDQPAAEQRRFNFFNYAADGQLNGSITMNELKMLSRTLLPSPDAYTIIDRQRASANGFLLAPSTPRNFVALQHLSPRFEFVPKSAVAKYRHISPDQFTIGRGEYPGQYLPLYTLFDDNPAASTSTSTNSTQNQVIALQKSTNVDGTKVTVNYYTAVTSVASPTPTSTTPTSTTTTTTTPTSTATTTTTPTSTATTTTASPTATSQTASTSSPGRVLRRSRAPRRRRYSMA